MTEATEYGPEELRDRVRRYLCALPRDAKAVRDAVYGFICASYPDEEKTDA